MRRLFTSALFLLLTTAIGFSQSTFRGGMAGIVTDSGGAAIPGAQIAATNVATGLVYNAASSDAGSYSISNLPLGDYNVAVSFAGFKTTQIKLVRISAGAVFSLPIMLEIASTAETVEVDAAAVSLDTTTEVRTFTLPKEEVTNIPINGRSFTAMTAFLPGNNTGTTRYLIDGVDNNDVYSNSVGTNQGGVGGVPGTLLPLDSVEEYSAEVQGSAENGGYSGTVVNLGIKSGTNHIHGSAYHYNRNEFFAVEGPFAQYAKIRKPGIRFMETGGSVGGPVIKDRIFYFLNYERQEYVLSQGTSSQTEPSGPYVNRALALLALGGVSPATNPSITMGENLITTLWQPGMLTGGAIPGNWTPPPSAAQHGYSNNAMMKFDQKITSANTLSERWYWGEGKQTAPLSTSQNPWYYQVAGERVDNIGVTLNTQVNSKSSNQLLFGVDYFNQPFSDAKPNDGAAGVGFIAGVGTGNTYGSPGLAISGFDGTGGTSVQIRNDYSGHVTDTYSIVIGKHQIRTGGEFRRLEIVEVNTGRGSSSIYTRGTFSFSGSRGYNAPSGGIGTTYPTVWPIGSAYSGTVDSQTRALADFLQGEGSAATLYNGDLDRTAHSNNFDLYFEDSLQVTHSFTLDYGLRWDFLSPITDGNQDLSTFRAGTSANSLDLTGGLAVVGKDISQAYKSSSLQFAPRLGFSWQPNFLHAITAGMVVRGAAGLYFDQPGPGTWLYATSLAGNPAGSRPLYNEQLTNENISPGLAIFPSNAAASIPNNGAGGQCAGATAATCPNLSIAAVDPNFSTGNTTNISASVQKALGSSAMIEVSYVGALGRHLANSLDLNQTTYGATTSPAVTNGFLYQQIKRPYFSQYPNFAKITQTASFGSSRSNALQAYIRARNWHGLISELSYALSTSAGTPTAGSIEDYKNPALDFGSLAVITNQVKGYWTYTIPGFKAGSEWSRKWLTGGWQMSGTVNFHGATALTATSSGSCNQSSANGNTYALTCSGLGLGEGASLASLTGLPRFCPSGNCGGTLGSGVTGTSRSKITNGYVQWFNPYSVISPPGCSTGDAKFGPDCSLSLSSYYGTTKRGQIHGAPGFGAVDLSVIKDFPVTEGVTAQFRGEMYNLFNQTNYKAPVLASGNTAADKRYGGTNISNSTSTGQVNSTIGGTSAPGIAEGEPFNVQLALKIIF
ncbi:MAG TPA: carboxypeptidase regulatory-like domain-containing protein [Terracidiphilus sp.]|nr:carboxypeptidase regulatory-like domain-containing protein [Terracidiphilus sp.]